MKNENAISKSHGSIAKIFHWSTAVLLGYGYATGVDDISQLADPTRFQNEIIFASVLGVAFLLRFIWMQRVNGPTRLSQDAPGWERLLSRIAHYGIYIGVAVIVLTGLAIAFGLAMPGLGGLFVLAMTGLHELALAATAVLMIAHVLGALWHKFVRKDAVWGSMLPSFRK